MARFISSIFQLLSVDGSQGIQISRRVGERDSGDSLQFTSKSTSAAGAPPISARGMAESPATEEGVEDREEAQAKSSTVDGCAGATSTQTPTSPRSCVARPIVVRRSGEGEVSRSRHRSFGPEPRDGVEDIAGRSPSSTVSRQCASSGVRLDSCVQFVERARRRLAEAEEDFNRVQEERAKVVAELSEGLARLETLCAEAAVPGLSPPPPAPSQETHHLQEVIRGLQAELATLRCSTFQDDESSLKKRRAAPSTPLAIRNGSSTPQ